MRIYLRLSALTVITCYCLFVCRDKDSSIAVGCQTLLSSSIGLVNDDTLGEREKSSSDRFSVVYTTSGVS